MLVIPHIPAHEWVDTQERAAEVMELAMKQDFVALDTETTGTSNVQGRVVDWSMAFPGFRYALSSRLLHFFKPLLEGDGIKVFHNAKFDMHMFANSGVDIGGEVHDTHVMSVVQNTERKPHTLKHLAGDGLFGKQDPRHLDYEAPFGGKVKNYNDLKAKIGDDKAREYASLDALATLHVYEELRRLLQENDAWEGTSMWEFYLQEEVPFTRVLYNCERRGILVDTGYLAEKSVEAEKRMESLLESFCSAAGMPINLQSPKQLREFFFDVKGKKPLEYTAGGASGNKQPSVSAHTLKVWAENGDPYASMLLEYRKLAKLNGTYLKGILELVDDHGRIHSTYNQGGTETGRISSKDPNMQNIPRPSSDIFSIRSAFVAPPGKLLIVADYDQLEMKLMADMADEDAMIDAINSGKDVHSATAALMYNVPYEAILEAKKKKDNREALTENQKLFTSYRQNAKTIGFGLNYGQGPTKLGAQLGINLKEALALIDLYFQPYPSVKGFIEDVHGYVTQHGLVRTLSGRPRHLRDGVQSDDDGMYARALRQAVNAVIQGSAADVVRKAMILCENDQRLKDLGCRQLLQVHDELMFECPEGNVYQAKAIIQELMESPYKGTLKVDLTAGPNYGFNWTQAK